MVCVCFRSHSQVEFSLPSSSTIGGIDKHYEDGFHFQYQYEAHAVALFPLRGTTMGGTELKVVGRNFVDSKELSCRFKSTSSTVEARIQARWESTSMLFCITPQLPPGYYRVEISNNGDDFTNDRVLFQTYPENKLLTVHPPSGSIFGGFEVFLEGSNFDHSSSALCSFGNMLVPVAYVTPSNVSCVAPPHQEGVVSVGYSFNGVGFVSLETPFEYFAVPIVTASSPSRGPSFGGTKVRVYGENFVEHDMVCSFGDQPAPTVEYISDTELICTPPPLPRPLSVSGCTGVYCQKVYELEVILSVLSLRLALYEIFTLFFCVIVIQHFVQ